MLNKRTALFFILQMSISLTIVETFSYLYLTNCGNALYRARRIVRKDEALGWMNNQNLATKFEGAMVYTDSHGFRTPASQLSNSANLENEKNGAENSGLLITLGPSSAFGWGVENSETYSAIAAQALKAGSENFSQIGYSSLQGLKLWDEISKKQKINPKWAIVSYGINDLDLFRFIGGLGQTEAEYLADKQRGNEINYGNTGTIIRLLNEELSLKFDCTGLTRISQRLKREETISAMQLLIENLKQKGVHVFLVNTPYKKQVYDKTQTRAEYENLYREVIDSASQHDCANAIKSLKKAKALEPWRIDQDVQLLNTDLEALARKENVSYIDAWSILRDHIEQHEVFFDPVHPGKLGHRIIAEKIISAAKTQEVQN